MGKAIWVFLFQHASCSFTISDVHFIFTGLLAFEMKIKLFSFWSTVELHINKNKKMEPF